METILWFNPFPPADAFWRNSRRQLTFENIVAKGEITHDEQFLLGPQCFQLYLTIKRFFMKIFQAFVTMFSKSSAADLLYVGNG